MCCEKLAIGAKKCIHCNCYQAAWKNRVSYFAANVGLITAIIAATTYLTKIVREEFFWKDKVTVSEYVGESHVVIYNFGDGRIFLKGLNTHFESQNGAFVDDYVLLNTGLHPL